MAWHEISVNFFDSLCSKRFRTFFLSLLRNQTETLATQAIFWTLEHFLFLKIKSDRVKRLN